MSSFHGEGVDLSIRCGRPPFGPGVEARLLLENQLIAVGSPALLAGAAPLTPKRLASSPLIHDGHDSWPAFLAQAGVASSSSKGIRFNQTGLAIDAAIAGQGLALTGRFFIESNLAAGRLVQVTPQVLHLGLDYYLVSPRRTRGEAPLGDVAAWLVEEATRAGASDAA